MQKTMQHLKYKVRFLTPAFLGNAEQSGQWRTPPFKALLRQWWRVAVAREEGYAYERLREREGRLFGNAWLTHEEGERTVTDYCKSQVRIRLDHRWRSGQMNNNGWPHNSFSQVETTRDGRSKVRSDVYLGYGPVLPPSKKEGRNSAQLGRTAIGDTERAVLTLLPGTDLRSVKDAAQLAHWFGTLGSRSRNGWGSLMLDGEGIQPPCRMIASELLKQITRPLNECLNHDWPHAIGKDDGGPLIWIGAPTPSWHKAIDQLARVLVQVRRTAKDHQPPGQAVKGIHLIGYPAGEGLEVTAWEKENARFASPLRFKVIKDKGDLRAVVFHMPSKLPKPLERALEQSDINWLKQQEQSVWSAIHKKLDQMSILKRVNKVW